MPSYPYTRRESTATPAYLLAAARLEGRPAIDSGDGTVYVDGVQAHDAATLNEALAPRPAEEAVAPAAGTIVAAQVEQMPAHVA